MNLNNPLPSLIADLRSKRLLPVVAVLVLALIAIPLALSRSASSSRLPSPASLAGVGTTTTPSGVPAVRVTKRSGRSRRLGSAHDPFIQQVLPQGAPAAASPAGAKTASTAGASATSSAPATTGAPASVAPATVTRTVTTPAATTPVAASPVYLHYAAKLSFGAAGTRLRVYNDPQRFKTLPSLRHLALVFLGLGSDGRTAEFLVADQVAAAGQGRCSPSRTHCVFLYMKPRQEEVFLTEQPSGNTSESVLHYLSVTTKRVSASSPGAVRVSSDGRRVVSWVAQLLPSLRKLRYGTRTGLLESTLTVPASRRAGIVVPIRLKRATGLLR